MARILRLKLDSLLHCRSCPLSLPSGKRLLIRRSFRLLIKFKLSDHHWLPLRDQSDLVMSSRQIKLIRLRIFSVRILNGHAAPKRSLDLLRPNFVPLVIHLHFLVTVAPYTGELQESGFKIRQLSINEQGTLNIRAFSFHGIVLHG
ncbi:hypothetical protein D3C77_377840 [compost metagenome]